MESQTRSREEELFFRDQKLQGDEIAELRKAPSGSMGYFWSGLETSNKRKEKKNPPTRITCVLGKSFGVPMEREHSRGDRETLLEKRRKEDVGARVGKKGGSAAFGAKPKGGGRGRGI